LIETGFNKKIERIARSSASTLGGDLERLKTSMLSKKNDYVNIQFGGVLILVKHTKESKEIIHKHTDIGEHFTREISPEYRIYFFTTRRKCAKD